MIGDEQPRHKLTTPGSKGATIAVPIADRGDVAQIEVLKDNDVVRLIRVSCACGNSVDIQCQYSE